MWILDSSAYLENKFNSLPLQNRCPTEGVFLVMKTIVIFPGYRVYSVNTLLKVSEQIAKIAIYPVMQWVDARECVTQKEGRIS